MKKTIFKTIIFITISIIISCANEKSEVRLDEKERLQIYDMRYLIADNGEYLNVILEENSKNVFIDYKFYTNQSIDMFEFNTEIDNGYISAEVINDNGIATMTGNLSDAGFNGKIDDREINFVDANSPISGAKVVRYTYTNVSPEDASEEDKKTFEYYSSIFLLNNDKKLASIDKINLDINSDMTSDKLDINKLSDIKNILSNDMLSYHNDWVESEYPNYASIFQYRIDYLSEKIASINRYYYLYIGGAHGIHGNIPKVYSLSDGKRLKIEDILIDVNDSNLINKVKEKLLSIRNEEDYFNLDEISLQENNFHITSKGLVFTWGVYEIGPYAMGYSEVLFSIDEIMPYLKDEYKSIFE
ncbi:RsiV family protein [Brachyspira sp.]|uniref:RsiV family protein n=1 Tax=Brachyspira sp. TaxID=1977261 RepID=UPI003D7C8C5E